MLDTEATHLINRDPEILGERPSSEGLVCP